MPCRRHRRAPPTAVCPARENDGQVRGDGRLHGPACDGVASASAQNASPNLGHSGSMSAPAAARRSTSSWLIQTRLHVSHTRLVTKAFSTCAGRNSPSPSSSRIQRPVIEDEVANRGRPIEAGGQNRDHAFAFLRAGFSAPLVSERMRASSAEAGSSFGSCGTSSPRKALARSDCVSLSTCACALA